MTVACVPTLQVEYLRIQDPVDSSPTTASSPKSKDQSLTDVPKRGRGRPRKQHLKNESINKDIEQMDSVSENVMENINNVDTKMDESSDSLQREKMVANVGDVGKVLDTPSQSTKATPKRRGRPRKNLVAPYQKEQKFVDTHETAIVKQKLESKTVSDSRSDGTTPPVVDWSKQKLVIRTRKQRQAEMVSEELSVNKPVISPSALPKPVKEASLEIAIDISGDTSSVTEEVCIGRVTEHSLDDREVCTDRVTESNLGKGIVNSTINDTDSITEPLNTDSTEVNTDNQLEEVNTHNKRKRDSVEGQTPIEGLKRRMPATAVPEETKLKPLVAFSCEEEFGDCVLKLTLPADDITEDNPDEDVLESLVEEEPFIKMEVPDESEPVFTMVPEVEQVLTEASRSGKLMISKEELTKVFNRRKPMQVCPECNKVFTSRSSFFCHLFYNGCKVLNNPDKIPDKVKEVIKDMQDNVVSPSCPLCDKKFKSQASAAGHYGDRVCQKMSIFNDSGLQKNAGGRYQCRECSYTHPKPSTIKLHEARYHWEKTEACPVCDKRFGHQCLLKAHIKYVHMYITEPMSTCHVCGDEMRSKHFAQHVRRYHDPSYVKPVYQALDYYKTCPYTGCMFKTRHQTDYRKHLKKRHEAPNKACDICGAMFHFHHEVKMHKKLKHRLGVESIQVNCPRCNKLLLKKNLITHTRLVHDKIKAYTCPICHMEVQTKSVLKTHMERHKPPAERETKYLCADCGKGFLNKTEYKDHTNTHTGLRPYLCNICGKGFKQASAYARHQEIHRGVKVFCEICNSSFGCLKYLQQHRKRVHENPHAKFVCSCGKEYQSYSGLCNHRTGCETYQAEQARQQVGSAGDSVDMEVGDENQTLYLQSEDGSQIFQAVHESTTEDGQTLVVLETVTDDNECETVAAAAAAVEEGVMSIVSSDVAGETQLIMNNEGHLEVDQEIHYQEQVSEVAVAADGSMDRYLCGYCQQLFVSLEIVQEHMLTEHMKDIPQVEGNIELALHSMKD